VRYTNLGISPSIPPPVVPVAGMPTLPVTGFPTQVVGRCRVGQEFHVSSSDTP
jgi:hypothetical protein